MSSCVTSVNNSCPLSFEIYSGSSSWTFESVDGATQAAYNGELVSVPVAKGPVVVEMVSAYLVVKSNLGFEIWWDQRQSLQVGR